MTQVLLVGFDGATFDVIHPLIAEGRLPNLAGVMARGAWGPLRSTMPPITPAAWTTVFTGKNPGKHGIYDFQEIDPATYKMRPVRNDHHRQKTLWQLLGEAGETSVIVDVPFTYPPQPLEGVMITGYGTPRTPGTVFTYPADLAARVPSEISKEVRVALPANRFDRSLAYVDAWAEIMAGRRKLLKHLIDAEDWRLFFIVFSMTDFMGHVFWTYLEPSHPNYHKAEGEQARTALYNAYEQCDALLGDLMAWAGPEAVTLVMSDHGFGSVYPRQYMFRKLVEGGYLRFQSPPGFSALGDKLMRTAMRAYTGLPFVREWVKNMRPGNQRSMKRALKRGGLMPSPKNIDFSQSQVITSSGTRHLWINTDDRFIQGIVPAEARGRVMAELSEYLMDLKDPSSNEPILENVHRGADIYAGPAAAAGPDLVLEYHNFYRAGAQAAQLNPRLEGGHTTYGIFLAQGPSIGPGQLRQADLTDIAPTILYLSGQPIPPDMDGRVLDEIFLPDYRARHPLRRGEAPARVGVAQPAAEDILTPEQEAEIETQLRQLGYID